MGRDGTMKPRWPSRLLGSQLVCVGGRRRQSVFVLPFVIDSGKQCNKKALGLFSR